MLDDDPEVKSADMSAANANRFRSLESFSRPEAADWIVGTCH